MGNCLVKRVKLDTPRIDRFSTVLEQKCEIVIDMCEQTNNIIDYDEIFINDEKIEY